MADLDAAIATTQHGIQVTPADHPYRGMVLSNLGSALEIRFERTGATSDLDAGINYLRDAISVTPPDHRQLGMRLANLGAALANRFKLTGAIPDIDAAIARFRDAIQATPAEHSDRAMHVSNLGGALQLRFKSTGVMADLDAAIGVHQEAIQDTPINHPDRAVRLSNFGIVLRAKFEHTGAAEDLDTAFQTYVEAASIAAPTSVRIQANRAAASLVAERDPCRAAGLLEAAVLLLPEVAARFLERGDQQYAIGRFNGLADDAAAAALSDPSVPESQRPTRALRLLEAARGVMLSQALSTRGDLSELRKRHPELAGRFTELRDWLDRPSPVPVINQEDGPTGGEARALQQARDRREAVAEFDWLLAHIRSLDGFAAFALPPTAEQLEAQGRHGPVVVLNVAAHRSDAIMLTSGGITSRPLPGLDPARVASEIKAFYQALDSIVGIESSLDRAGAQEVIRQVLGWLWDNAAGPVLDALGYTEPPSPGQGWPQVWWVPSGLLGLLPVHAAGHHASPQDPAGRAVMDRVISSYTPTVGALAYARTPRTSAPPGAEPRSLIVAMPTTPDLPHDGRLTYVSAEAAMLRQRFPHSTLLIEPPDGHDTTGGWVPTRSAVMEHLPGSAIAHFACHGHTDTADPSQSRLLLHDHLHNPLTVAALAPLVLDHARLAYLSACSTARTKSLLDEAIHLVSAFQLVGFPHVIGTLWEINDATALKIADSFYSALADPDGTLNLDRAPQALHHAVRAQRDRHPANPYLWASHIHAGA